MITFYEEKILWFLYIAGFSIVLFVDCVGIPTYEQVTFVKFK